MIDPYYQAHRASTRRFSMRASIIISTIALLASSAASSNLPCFNDICWTSWRCWYERSTSTYGTKSDRCGLPHNVYRQGYDDAPWTTLVWGEGYEMTWQSSYESQGEDIVLEWLMFEAPGTESIQPPNSNTQTRSLTSSRANPSKRDRHVPRLPRQRTRALRRRLVSK
jgi:hypothetical protein